MSTKKSDKAKQKADDRFKVCHFMHTEYYGVVDNSTRNKDFVARNITNPLHAEKIRKCYVAMWHEQWEKDEAFGTHQPVEIKYEVVA